MRDRDAAGRPGTPVDCLFVGAGAVADQYAADIDDSPLSLTAVCDTDGERAAALAAEHGATAVDDLGDALAATDAPVAVNLTSHAAHAAVSRQCLEAGRHVYSEKPLALDPDEGGALLDTATQRGLGLACAPVTPRCRAQRLAGRALADGRLGPVRLGYAHAHVGRVIEWHDRPDSFLTVGPLYDGGVYPLALLVSWFGPVERVRVADSLSPWPDRESAQPSAPTHVEATLAFAAGPTVRLTASLYAPHRSQEFYGLELHGDDGSLYLQDAGALTAATDTVSFGRTGRAYTPMPPQSPGQDCSYLDDVERLAAAVVAGEPARARASARRSAHVVAICDGIQRAATDGGPVAVADYGATADPVPAPTVRPAVPNSRPDGAPSRALRLPRVGFGCSRYRGDEYVDRVDAIETALDAGYRLLDSAELYGNEHRIGDLLAAPGAPDRDALFVLGKAWRTNHDHVLEACAGSREELGVDAFDCYTLHWPEAWAYQGPLRRLADVPVDKREAVTFPHTDGDIETADVSLTEAWANLETVYDRGWARTLGLCNVSRTQVERILDAGRVRPSVVQVERHPYKPRHDLVEFCHDRGIRVIAHSPLSAPGLLSEPVLESIAGDRSLSPAGVVVAWNATDGVVPIPASNDREHIVENLAAAGEVLSDGECERIATLADPDFER